MTTKKMKLKLLKMKRRMSGERNPMYGKKGPLAPNWKERPAPSTIHIWLHKNYKLPELCEMCREKPAKLWANTRNHNYVRNREDYIGICIKCHQILDGHPSKGKKLNITEEDRQRRSNQMKEMNKTHIGRKLNLSEEERQRRGRQVVINRWGL